MDAYIRKAVISNIVDGDTVDAVIDLGYNVTVTHRLRLLKIDTPERHEEGWAEATEFTRKNLLNEVVFIKSVKADSFGRYLADIYFLDGTNFNQQLLDNGYAKPYIK